MAPCPPKVVQCHDQLLHGILCLADLGPDRVLRKPPFVHAVTKLGQIAQRGAQAGEQCVALLGCEVVRIHAGQDSGNRPGAQNRYFPSVYLAVFGDRKSDTI